MLVFVCVVCVLVIEVAVGEYGSDINTLVDAATDNIRPALPYMEHEVQDEHNGMLWVQQYIFKYKYISDQVRQFKTF